MEDQLGPLRTLSDGESRLLTLLVGKAQLDLRPGWWSAIRVQLMADGGMGSLRVAAIDGAETDRRLGARVAECQFQDQDGIEVIASLNVDQNGDPFELDIWKTDFAALIRIPEQLERDSQEVLRIHERDR